MRAAEKREERRGGMYVAEFELENLEMKSWNWILVLPLVLACSESVESTDIRTTGIYPEIVVTATGNGTSLVEVRLKVGGRDSNTLLDLKGADTLEATVAGTTKTLDEVGSQRYRASFPVEAEGTEFEIAFLRGDEDENAPSSTVSLPSPFDLSVESTEVSRATDAVAFTWVPPGSGNVDWEVEGECTIREDGNTPDDGAGSIAAGVIETFESDMAESCTVDLTVTRGEAGAIDPAFTEGGSIVARQVRSASFTSTP